jgi:hypothetical protein
VVNVPLVDSLRSVGLWFVLLGLLLFRKPNRTAHARTLLLPLMAVYLTLHIVESQTNTHVLFYIHRYICSGICELLRALTVGLAVLLAISDLITFRNRVVRFIAVFLILFFVGTFTIRLNTPVILATPIWTAMFGFVLFVFMISHAIIHTLLRWLSRRHRLAWCGGVSFMLGCAPILTMVIVEKILSRSMQLQSTWEVFRLIATLSQAVSGPYFVFFWFVLLALLSRFYRQRIALCFGYDAAHA